MVLRLQTLGTAGSEIIIVIIKLYFNTIKSGMSVPFTGVYIRVNN